MRVQDVNLLKALDVEEVKPVVVEKPAKAEEVIKEKVTAAPVAPAAVDSSKNSLKKSKKNK
jgi:hypothetical protein